MSRIASLGMAVAMLASFLPVGTAHGQGLADLFKGLSNQGNSGGGSWNSGGNRNQYNNRSGFNRGGYYSDANDGGDAGDVSPWKPPRPTSPQPSNPFPWDRLVVDIIDAAMKAPKPQPNYPDRYREPNYPPRYTYPQQPQYQPQYQQQPVPARPVAVRSNTAPKPVEKKLMALANYKPMSDNSLSLTDGERELMEKLATDKAEEKVEKLEESLGKAADDPAVKAELDKIKEKLANGEEITQADTDKLIQVASASPDFPADFDQDKANKLVLEIEEWSALVPKLREEGNNNGGGQVPGGSVDVVNFPGLPPDDMVMLPDGTVLVGTGGQGTISSVSMESSDVFGMPIGIGEPMPDYDGEFSKRVKDGVLLMNPAENEVPINYIISNTDYTMKAGHSQPLPAGKSWVIRFDRGEGHGEAKYTLTDGTYFFGPSEKGWELFKQTFAVTIDNTEHQSDFNYNIDNKQVVVAAGSTETHRSNYPILVRFDRGDGTEAQKRVLKKDEHLQIAVDPSVGLWDLYPAHERLIAAVDAGGEKPRRSRAGGSKGTTETTKARAARLRALLMQTSSRD